MIVNESTHTPMKSKYSIVTNSTNPSFSVHKDIVGVGVCTHTHTLANYSIMYNVG